MSTTNILDLNNRIDELEKNSGGGGSADSAKRSDIATEFSTETSYTAGNFVYHEGKLYQFNADHSAGAWDPTDVVEANVTDQIVSNKAAIDGLTASDIMLSDGVTSIQDRVSQVNYENNSIINIASATDSNPFIAPYDGYCRLEGPSSCDLQIGNSNVHSILCRGTGAGTYISVFVKAGTSVYVSGTPTTVYFIPLK